MIKPSEVYDMVTILIVDDEQDILNALKIYLSDSQYQLLEAHDGLEALEILRKESVQLVLMDIMMPKMDGIQALSELRTFSNVPVIFLTAKSEDTDILLGLNVGADDYITKPFNPLEVHARVRSALRRYMTLGGEQTNPDTYVLGDVELDDKAKLVRVNGEIISVTPTEFEILKLLMANPNTVFSPKQIYQTIWNETPEGCENTIAVHIRHLREKIEIDPAHPRTLQVVWGQGYKMTDLHHA